MRPNAITTTSVTSGNTAVFRADKFQGLVADGSTRFAKTSRSEASLRVRHSLIRSAGA